MAAVTFGVDISNNNPGFPVADLKRQGFDFLMCKISEGTGFYDLTFEPYRAEAEREGQLFAAYHALHRGNAAAQADWLARHLTDKTIPVMIDDEPFGDNPTRADALAFKKRCKQHGLLVTMHYHPNWYWQQVGRLLLVRLPRLVSSSYPSSAHKHASELYPGDKGEGWKRYGGRTPVIWQFSSTALVDGYQGNVDVNAFRGTRDQLAALGLFKDYSGKTPPHPHRHPDGKRHPWWRIHHLLVRVARLRARLTRGGH